MKREREEVTTAVDYVKEQDELEREAREIMPFDPDECTYQQGEIRQMVFACLTCSRQNSTPIGICYSCSIQCHASHELVELFSKRNFVCDCGTTKMSETVNGGCRLRLQPESKNGSRSASISESITIKTGISRRISFSTSQSLELPAEDIPGSNSYNQNFSGKFCHCEQIYNPLKEEGTMFQCYFGFECGEDWYHDDCILGYEHNCLSTKELKVESSNGESLLGVNILDKLPEAEDEAATNKSFASFNDSDGEEELVVPHFPSMEDFDVFICWKCADKFAHIFEKFNDNIVLTALPHFEGITSLAQWEELYEKYKSSPAISKSDEPQIKKTKLDDPISKSYFFKYGFKPHLKALTDSQDEKLKQFLLNNSYLYSLDPIYEPPEKDGHASSTGSLLDLGAEALQALPRDQAVEGLQAYDKIRNKLRDFFKPFAEEGKVVTEDEVRQFFSDIKDKEK